MPLALLSITMASAAQAQPYPCSASTATVISRSAGGTCADGLALNEEFTLTYRVTNLSIVDDPGGPADGTAVTAEIPAGEELLATLAQQDPQPNDTELQGILQFIPVCPVGSAGGPVAAGQECVPASNDCGNMECGCVSALPGVGCHETADPDQVHLAVGQDVAFTPSQQRTLATIRVRVIGTVPPPAACGLFYTRIDSTGDIVLTTDALCETQVSAGAQASADLQSPVCLVDSDCGDPDCNVCADVGTNNHCAPRAADTACGTDEQAGDCLLPGCVINQNNVGVCTQGVNDAPEDTACTNNDGVPVPEVECQMPQCNASGTCVNVADPSQNNDSCGIDANLNDCTAPACVNGACAQGVLDEPAGGACTNNNGVPVPAVLCQTPECNADGLCVNTADPTQNGTPCGTDQNETDCKTPACLNGACEQNQNNVELGTPCAPDDNICTDDLCDANGVCQHTDNTVPCSDGLFCTAGDICTGGTCTSSLVDCSDEFACTEDICNEDLQRCENIPHDNLCDDGDDCTTDTCDVDLGCLHVANENCQAICRTPGYWATHSGTEKGAVNVAQLIINETGPLHVCGETITSTSNALGSLSSDLEGLCVKVAGVTQRQLYRQLVAAALNCAISDIDCDTLTDGAFSECNALCADAGTDGLTPVDTLTMDDCISLIDCFNNGNQVIDGTCASGTCAHDTDIACGSESGACPLYNGQSQACVPFENSCHDQPMCNESLDLCPNDTRAGSSNACNQARDNSCTIDSCP